MRRRAKFALRCTAMPKACSHRRDILLDLFPSFLVHVWSWAVRNTTAIYGLKYDTHETHIIILGYLKILFVLSVSHDLPWLNINMSSTMFDMAQAYFGTLHMPNFDPDQCHSMSFIHQHAYRGLIRRGGWRLGRQLFGETDSAALPLSVVGMQSKLSFQAQVELLTQLSIHRIQIQVHRFILC